MKEGTTELCDWARRRLGLREPPSFNMALASKHISYFAK